MAFTSFNEMKEKRDIERWLKKPQPKTVSGRYYFPIPPHVYSSMGGFKELHKRYQQWREEDEGR